MAHAVKIAGEWRAWRNDLRTGSERCSIPSYRPLETAAPARVRGDSFQEWVSDGLNPRHQTTVCLCQLSYTTTVPKKAKGD